jgi:chromosome segregation ATPase
MATRSSDDFDSDLTDELPVLREAVALGDGRPIVRTERRDDTAEQEALQEPDSNEAEAAERRALHVERPEEILSLEAQIRVLTDSVRDLEEQVAQKDGRIADLNVKLATLRRVSDEAAAAQRHSASEVAARDARLAELTATVERLERDASSASAELAQLRSLAAAAHRETEALRSELGARPARATVSPAVQELREDHAALADYVASRRASWDAMQTTSEHLAGRVATLEQELKTAAKRLAAADALASRESSRAVALRAELVDSTRRVENLEAELRRARSAAEPHRQPVFDGKAAASPSGPTDFTQLPVAPLPAGSVAPHARAAQGELCETPPVLTDAVDAAAPAVEAIAQLEGEVEYKRQQVAAQLIELRDREQRLRDATRGLEQSNAELALLRSELDASRSKVARLERTIGDKERDVEARDAKIAVLHEELEHRIGRKRSAVELSSTVRDAPATARSGAREAAEHTTVPALLCLTGDAPKRFALTKKTVTVGRGPHCDLQILTHFVSREHARLTLNGEGAVIEDLGSRNGVYVNAVRVDRRPLQQGDLVTIGETQFRFVESMAH